MTDAPTTETQLDVKPAKAEAPKKKPQMASPEGVPLSAIAAKLKIDPKAARVILRKHKAPRLGKKGWCSPAETARVLKNCCAATTSVTRHDAPRVKQGLGQGLGLGFLAG